jgi:mRNA interferase MazF
VSRGYVPDVGDIVWLTFDPRVGHEQSGHRPALVLTPARYNGNRGLMIACPMTSRIKGYVFEIIASRDPDSVVLADQARCVDWRERRTIFKEKASAELVAEVREKLGLLLGI